MEKPMKNNEPIATYKNHLSIKDNVTTNYTTLLTYPLDTEILDWNHFGDDGKNLEKYRSENEHIDFEITPILAEKILNNAEKRKMSADNYLKKIINKKESKTKPFSKVRKLKTKVDLSLSRKWLAENQHNYIGKWVVLDGDKLIAASENPSELVKKVKELGIKNPFIQFIEDKSKPFIGGWL
jgi:hypothetical protein